MYGLPPATTINKPLYKKTVYEKFSLKAIERERFDSDISRMAITARISTATVPALSEGNDIKGIYVLQVMLKRKDYDTRNILLLQKLIPQRIVFAMQYGDQTQLCVFYVRMLQSPWMPNNETVIPLQGLTLDEVWTSIVAAIGGLDTSSDETLERQIIRREQHEKLQQQIVALEKKCRTEKQTHKRYELYQQIMKLKEDYYGKD